MLPPLCVQRLYILCALTLRTDIYLIRQKSFFKKMLFCFFFITQLYYISTVIPL